MGYVVRDGAIRFVNAETMSKTSKGMWRKPTRICRKSTASAETDMMSRCLQTDRTVCLVCKRDLGQLDPSGAVPHFGHAPWLERLGHCFYRLGTDLPGYFSTLGLNVLGAISGRNVDELNAVTKGCQPLRGWILVAGWRRAPRPFNLILSFVIVPCPNGAPKLRQPAPILHPARL